MDKTVDELIRRTGQLMACSNYRSVYGESHKFECITKEVERMKNEMKEKILRDAYDSWIHIWPLDMFGLQPIPMSTYGQKITDVNIVVPNKVVEVTFMDGDKQKAVCQEPDVFSLEQAISICLTKHLLGGSGTYNKAIKNGIKVYEKKIAEDKAAKVEAERIDKRRAKKAVYMKRKAEKKREEQIEIQKEAYVRAMEYMKQN